ncbi:YbgC/FadM family acyl-CoA thioesterase [Cupriavidus taiwanensis]|uniref:YbgC/FadM family acyl-CoA thioesterase n=1 Tax=Cupriavidus taiwanensis TaxID=164546 RepID=UPI000E2E87D6|nr:YbgC/FadM family acyl-CoA thioesterase [Cupriavidus taiwanensis]
MAKKDFRHSMPVRVRWSEVDPQSIVFNSHYLTYCNICMTEYWRALRIRPNEEILEAHGVQVVVAKSTLEYHAPAYFDDMLDVRARIAHLGRSSIVFRMEIYRGDMHLVSAELIAVCISPAVRESVPVPAPLRAIIDEFEAAVVSQPAVVHRQEAGCGLPQ